MIPSFRMKTPFAISLVCFFQIITDATDAGKVVPGITTLDYYDYVDDHYDGNASFRSGKLNSVKEGNVVELSEEVFKNIGSVSDMRELQRILGIEVPPTKVFKVFRSSLDEEASETRSRNAVRYMGNPKQGNCAPELHSVDLGLISTADVTYYPTCVRVHQCGGCCPNKEIISCQPIASEKVVVPVYELILNPEENVISSSRSSRRGSRRNKVQVQPKMINVTVEEHTDCACLCKLTENNCNLDVHLYDEKNCACICKNLDEQEKCYRKSTHYWRRDTCECLCRHKIACSSSEEFDHSSCTCKSTSLGYPLNNVWLRKRQSWESHLRRRPIAIPIRT